jgi:radical SAM superfamily enzyme YgiQ (UPF0313 family)
MEAKEYSMDIGVMGAIGEGEALKLRTTRNCPWNKCIFCPVYKGRKFGYREVGEIKRDIDAAKEIADLIENTSLENGFGGRVNTGNIEMVLADVIKFHPEIYENYIARRSLSNVANWMLNGKKRVSLEDADSLFMKPNHLVEVLKYLRDTFPTIEVISSYARSRTCSQRELKQLKELKESGLSLLLVGIESGCDEVLEYMKKGVTAEQHIQGGRKVMEAGIDLANYIMPGLGSGDKRLSEKHVLETIGVLNKIQPTEVRIRSLAVLIVSKLYPRWRSGEFKAPTEDQMIDEIKRIIENMGFDCIIETLQLTNVLFNIRDKLSKKSDWMLKGIAKYQEMPLMEKLKFKLNKYVYGGYLDYIRGLGLFGSQLNKKIEEAKESIENKSPDAEEKTERAIFAIKSIIVP